MTITTKYSLGQIVHSIRKDFATRIVKCQCCKNTGKVTINEVEYTCPKCKGKANTKEQCGIKWFVWDEGEIGKISFEMVAGKYAAQNTNMPSCFTEEHLATPDETTVRYMISATGIGSGTLWDEEDLFATREDAKAKCDEENAKLPKDEA